MLLVDVRHRAGEPDLVGDLGDPRAQIPRLGRIRLAVVAGSQPALGKLLVHLQEVGRPEPVDGHVARRTGSSALPSRRSSNRLAFAVTHSIAA